jgi:hypothetical protein
VPWPTFLVIGAYKSGTTALHHALRVHPEVFVPAYKEPGYFAFADRADPGNPAYGRSVHDEARYLALFDDAPTDARAVGEVSPEYLLNPAAPASIARRVPDVKLLAVLRHPVDRAFSDWVMYVRDGRERHSFVDAIEMQDERRARGDATGHYLEAGEYGRQLHRYLERFPREHLNVWLYDDLVADEVQTLREVYSAIGVDATVRLPTQQHNVGHLPASRRDRALLTVRTRARPVLGRLPLAGVRARLSRSLEDRLVQPTLDPEVRAQLTERFRPDIERLQERLGRDLSAWLDTP